MAYSIKYVYDILDKYSPAMDRMRESSKKFNKSVTNVQKGLGKIENKFKSAGSKMANLQTGLAALGTGVVLKGALDASVKFGDNIASIGTLIPGQEKRLKSLSNTITDVAIASGKDLNDIAGGAFQVISAFGDMEGETEGRLKAVTNAAVAGGSSTSEALSLLSAVTKSYGDTSTEALKKASDLAFMTNVLGQTTFPEMAASMGRVLPLTAKMSVSQEELFAAMASLTGVTGSTAEVSTQLSAVMSSLIKPTESMKSAVDKLGFSSVSAMVKEKGLSTSLNLLNKSTGGSEEAIGKLFGSKEAMTAFFALTGAQADKFSESLIKMGEAANSGGATTKAALLEMTNTPGFKLRQMTASFQALKISMGDMLATTLTPLIDKMTKFSNKLRNANPLLLKIITYTMLAITVIGAIVVPMGILISSIGSIIGLVKIIIGLTKLWTAVTTVFNIVMALNPIVWVVAGIVALIAVTVLIIKYWDEFKNIIAGVWEWFMKMMDNPIFASAAMFFAPFLAIPALIIKNWTPIKEFFLGVWEVMKNVFDLVLKIGKNSLVGRAIGFVADKAGFGAKSSPPATEEVPRPSGSDINANANASVSVYTEKGMGVTPFTGMGNLGYNMSYAGAR